MLYVLIIIFLIICSSFFTITELSLIASRKQRLQSLADDGNNNAKQALHLNANIERVIASTQIGLTCIAVLAGAITDQVIAPMLHPFFIQYSFIANYSKIISSIISLSSITFLTILIGDILPKRIALIYPEAIAMWMAPIATSVLYILTPLINVFSFLSNAILRIFGMPTKLKNIVLAEDIEDLFEAGARSGLLDRTEKNLLDNVWRMDERKVGALMTPRAEIIYIDINASYKDNLEIVLNNPERRILVCNEDLDHVLGICLASVWIKDILRQLFSGNTNPTVSWVENLLPLHSIPNSLTLIETLEAFRKYKTHIALVYNEFGHVEGIISMVDLMGAVVGESPDIADEDLLIIKDSSGKWLIDGLAPIDDVKNALNISEFPDENLGNYQTASGFVMSILGRSKGRLPKEFDKFNYAGYIFEIVDIDRTKGYRIDQIMVQIEKNPMANQIK